MGTTRKSSVELDVSDATGDGLSCADVRQVVELALAEVASADTPALAEVASADTVTQATHMGVQFVERGRIHELNRQFRGVDGPTDVLSFPVDCDEVIAGPRELGDVIICPGECDDLKEGLVHGILHLLGYDHEVDQGEMLALQSHVMGQL